MTTMMAMALMTATTMILTPPTTAMPRWVRLVQNGFLILSVFHYIVLLLSFATVYHVLCSLFSPFTRLRCWRETRQRQGWRCWRWKWLFHTGRSWTNQPTDISFRQRNHRHAVLWCNYLIIMKMKANARIEALEANVKTIFGSSIHEVLFFVEKV